MAKLPNKKIVSKGIRLRWASLKDAKMAKVTLSLTSIRGVKVKRSKVFSVRKIDEGGLSTKRNYIIS